MYKMRLWARHAWAPLAVIAFAFTPQRGVRFQVVDEYSEVCFGSPVIWQCDPVSSLEFFWYLGPLAIDVIAYSSAAFGVVWLWRRLPIPAHWVVSRVITPAVWIVGLGSFCLVLAAIVGLGHYGGWWYSSPEDIVDIGWGALFSF